MDNQTVAATLARLKAEHDRDMAKIQNVKALAAPMAESPSVANAIEEIRHVVADLSEKLHGGSTLGTGMAEHLPALIEAATSLARRPRLRGMKHTGEVVYHQPGQEPDHALRPRSVRRTESGDLELEYA